MEQYEFADEKLEPVIIDGKYYQRIHKKHINSYGEKGADNIADNVIKISACLASPLWSFRKRLDAADDNGEDTSFRREVYLRLFYSLFNNNMSFRTLVVNNAPNAKNVEHLAKMCGHSLSHFKLLFSQHFDTTPYVWMQRNRAIEISELLRDTSIPLKSIIKKYGFTSHGHFSLFCRKFLGDTPRTLRRRSHLTTTPVTLDDVKRHMERQRRQTAAVKKASATGEAPRRRGRPRKNEVRK